MTTRITTTGLSLASLFLASTGCTTIRVSDAGRATTYVGIVRVVTPRVTGEISAVDVKALGAGWDKGPFLGWKAANHVSADPGNCQLLIVARSRAQMQNAETILNLLKGQSPCIANFSR